VYFSLFPFTCRYFVSAARSSLPGANRICVPPFVAGDVIFRTFASFFPAYFALFSGPSKRRFFSDRQRYSEFAVSPPDRKSEQLLSVFHALSRYPLFQSCSPPSLFLPVVKDLPLLQSGLTAYFAVKFFRAGPAFQYVSLNSLATDVCFISSFPPRYALNPPPNLFFFCFIFSRGPFSFL